MLDFMSTKGLKLISISKSYGYFNILALFPKTKNLKQRVQRMLINFVVTSSFSFIVGVKMA